MSQKQESNGDEKDRKPTSSREVAPSSTLDSEHDENSTLAAQSAVAVETGSSAVTASLTEEKDIKAALAARRTDQEEMVGAIRMVGDRVLTKKEGQDYDEFDKQDKTEMEEETEKAKNSADTDEEAILIQAHLVEDAQVTSARQLNGNRDTTDSPDQISSQRTDLVIEHVFMDETHPQLQSSPPLVEASPLEIEQMKPVSLKSLLFENRKVQGLILLLVLVTVGVTLGIVFGIQNNSSNNDPAQDTLTGNTRETFVRDVLPDYTKEALKDPESDQSMALDWLWRDPGATATLPNFRRVQRFALAVAFYACTNYDTNTAAIVTNWLSDDHECTWPQLLSSTVVCRDDRLQVLIQNGDAGITGTLPPEIGLLTDLVFFDLSDTLLHGSIPSTIGLMTNLDQIQLVNTKLSGTMPTEFGKLTKMRHLLIANGHISGTLPSELGHLTNAWEIQLSGQIFQETIPSEFGRMKSAWHIQLSGQNLRGTIPSEIWALTELRVLSLYNNSLLSGTLPTDVGLMKELQVLAVAETEFSGTIPTELALIKSLEQLVLHETGIRGTIPTAFQYLSVLHVLTVHETMVSGYFPLCDLVNDQVLERATVDCYRVDCDCCECLTKENQTSIFGPS